MTRVFDYTTKDYQGFKEDMLELIPKIMPEWTDRSPNDPGITILELLAYQLDKNSYYQDRIANETYLATATQRRSVIKHCRLIGYELAWHKASRYNQVFEIEPQPEDTIIPAGFQVGTVGSAVEEPIIFETLEDLVIPAGATGLEKDEQGNYLYSVVIEHGQRINGEFIGSFENSNPYQEFRLHYSPVLKESIEIEVQEVNGTTNWERVDDFISSQPSDNHYVVEMDENDEVIIKFGSGVSGRVPVPPASVYVNYKIGGGTIGNVGANSIIEFYDSVPGLIATFNPEGPFLLGEDKETIEHAKIYGPASVKVQNRYVVEDDYEKGIVLDMPEVIKARAVNVEGDIHLYVLSREGTALSPELKEEALEIINRKKMMFTDVVLKDPVFVPVDITVSIEKLFNHDAEMVRYTAENSLRELFAPEYVDFGKALTVSEVHTALFGIPGIYRLSVQKPTVDTDLDVGEIPTIGTLTVLVDGK